MLLRVEAYFCMQKISKVTKFITNEVIFFHMIARNACITGFTFVILIMMYFVCIMPAYQLWFDTPQTKSQTSDQSV